MRVKELKLHNFRGIKDLHLVFNPEHNVVVLVGINGIGKSSILDCINLLFQYYYKIWEKHIMSKDDGGINNEKTGLLESDIYVEGDCTTNQIGVNTLDSENQNISTDWKIARFKDEDFPFYKEDDYHCLNLISLSPLADPEQTGIMDRLASREIPCHQQFTTFQPPASKVNPSS